MKKKVKRKNDVFSTIKNSPKKRIFFANKNYSKKNFSSRKEKCFSDRCRKLRPSKKILLNTLIKINGEAKVQRDSFSLLNEGKEIHIHPFVPSLFMGFFYGIG